MASLTWIGIGLCLAQSAVFSGLNLAVFSLGTLELEVEAKKGNRRARAVLALRDDANFTLVTILWGNVAVNVLLALLADSVLVGVVAFLFSTVVITVFAEIIPQAYFSRHALVVASTLAPLLRAYRVVLAPVAKPTAWVLDRWLGREGIRLFDERDLRRVIQLHMASSETDVARLEGQGALNFLDIDDVALADEGEPIAPESVVSLEVRDGSPLFPAYAPSADDPFLRRLFEAGKTWTVLTDRDGEPLLVLDTTAFLAAAIFERERPVDPRRYCHRPIVVRDDAQRLGRHLSRFRVASGAVGTEIIEHDVIVVWGEAKRIITGTDVLGRLFRGIGQPVAS
jgi:metal transporter CNNM